MGDLILKAHGAIANGLISQEEDGSWRCSFLVRDLEKEIQQHRGPELLATEAQGRDWVVRQGKFHGFQGDDFDVQVETL